MGVAERNLETILQALENTPGDHLETLFGERKAGSKWGREFNLLDLKAMRWYDHTQEVPQNAVVPNCTYYQALIPPEWGSCLGAVGYGYLYEREQAHVVEVTGLHGVELQISMQDVGWTNLSLTSIATLITGPHDNGEVVYTIHPGHPLAPYKGVREEETAVKVVP